MNTVKPLRGETKPVFPEDTAVHGYSNLHNTGARNSDLLYDTLVHDSGLPHQEVRSQQNACSHASALPC